MGKNGKNEKNLKPFLPFKTQKMIFSVLALGFNNTHCRFFAYCCLLFYFEIYNLLLFIRFFIANKTVYIT